MMGDFLSCHVPSHGYAQELKSRLTQLGHYLNSITPELCKHTTFVLMPGPGDRYCGAAGASILPRYLVSTYCLLPYMYLISIKQLILKIYSIFCSKCFYYLYCFLIKMLLFRPSIPECLTEEFRRLVPRCVFTTNPCRIQYCTQQLHIIRADGLMKKTANYDVRYRSMDQKNCSSVTKTDDDSAVKNVSCLKC